MTKRFILTGSAIAVLCALAACSTPEMATPAQQPLSKDAMMLLGKKGMKTESPIFVRIFKEESELEIWKLRDDGRYHHFKTYPICTWSGDLGPKIVQGDKQAPEGFYQIYKSQMNPNSQFHLAFNIGYPNSYDKSHGRTGSALMVHGKCKSAGCYAMTDALIEEIYALAREQYADGLESFPVHAFPFRMTIENMARYQGHKWFAFWLTLKEGYDAFETTRQVPSVTVCEKRYNVNVRPAGKLQQSIPVKIEADGRCPRFEKLPLEAFVPPANTKDKVAEVQVKAPGAKMRAVAAHTPVPGSDPIGGLMSGLTTGSNSGGLSSGGSNSGSNSGVSSSNAPNSGYRERN